jgi:toxin-antitoxin system PIN domain toxin
MFLVDANVLVYAADSSSIHHEPSAAWLDSALNGSKQVALPWQCIGSFLRLVTNPRVMATPMSPNDAWAQVQRWLEPPTTWIPLAGLRTAALLGEVLGNSQVTGNLISDAQLAAIALEHGLTVVTLDSDFGRFPVPVLDPRRTP